jgi:hypothetical protein
VAAQDPAMKSKKNISRKDAKDAKKEKNLSCLSFALFAPLRETLFVFS